MEKLLYRVPEAAQVLGQGKTAIYEEMAAGRLSYVKRGRARLIPAEALTAYVTLLESEMVAGTRRGPGLRTPGARKTGQARTIDIERSVGTQRRAVDYGAHCVLAHLTVGPEACPRCRAVGRGYSAGGRA